jgi:hypothetical protein
MGFGRLDSKPILVPVADGLIPRGLWIYTRPCHLRLLTVDLL